MVKAITYMIPYIEVTIQILYRPPVAQDLDC